MVVRKEGNKLRKAALHNLGCKVNAYETESMQQMLEAAGYEIVPFEEWADVYVVNTCTVTNMADRKSRQMLHRAKKKNPDSVVVAAGCYVQVQAGQGQLEEGVDIWIGNNKKHELARLLETFFTKMEKEGKAKLGNGSHAEEIEDIASERTYEELGVCRTAEHTRVFLKVQDGCNQFCSYCIIPYARGRVRSRSISNVRKEVEALAANGYQEVVLTGIHLSSYGVDFAQGQGKIGLLELIQEIHKVPGIERIRLGSLEPKIITEQFVQELAKLPKICPHFHLSLQSGCDTTLQRMNRKYTCAEYEEGCQVLRRYFDHPAITTDVIVGFPGETEEEFQITREFLKRIGFFEIHVFKYSIRKGTRAADMQGQVPEEIKNKRSDTLLSDTALMKREFLEWYLGKELELLVEEKAVVQGKEFFLGHTKEYVRVAVPVSGCGKPGMENQFVVRTASSIWNGQEKGGIHKAGAQRMMLLAT